MFTVLEIVIGVLYASLAEWLLHKYVLHGVAGSVSRDFQASHWIHHRAVRKYALYDPRYEKPFWHWEVRGKEIVAVWLLLALHTPLVFVAPAFLATIVTFGFSYLYLHRKMHLQTGWGKRWFPGHMEHHLVGNQQHSYNVLLPIWDYLLRTRAKDTKRKKK